MACAPLILDGQVVGIMCGVRRRKCTAPGCREPAEFLCDFPLRGARKGATCSRGVCGDHRVRLADNVDYCTTHAKVSTMDILVRISFHGAQPPDRAAAIALARAHLSDFARPPAELKPLGWKVANAVRLVQRESDATKHPWSITLTKSPSSPQAELPLDTPASPTAENPSPVAGATPSPTLADLLDLAVTLLRTHDLQFTAGVPGTARGDACRACELAREILGPLTGDITVGEREK